MFDIYYCNLLKGCYDYYSESDLNYKFSNVLACSDHYTIVANNGWYKGIAGQMQCKIRIVLLE